MSVVLRAHSDTSPIPFARTEISPEARDAAAEVLASGWVTTGPEVGKFEEEMAGTLGVAHAVAVSSCTCAIELSLRALRLPPGAKVLTSTMTFCGAVNAIVHAGLQPVLVDVNPETLMPDAATTAAAAGRAGGVDAMVVLHFAGHPAPVQEMAEAAGLPLSRVIEDAAHALGTWVGERPVGGISAATCFSFYATKNLPIGEGGMVTTQDQEIADFVRRARLHGMSRDAWKRYLPGSTWRYSVEEVGLKANMTDIQAAIGRGQLIHFPRWQERRSEIALRYHVRLSAVPGIQTPPWPHGGRHAWHIFVIRVEPSFGMDRDSFIAALNDREIGTSVHFIPVHHQPYYQRLLGDGATGFPVADTVFPSIVSLPLHPGLTDEQVDRICFEIADIRVQRPEAAIHALGGVVGNGHAAVHDRRPTRCLIVDAGPSGRGIAEDLQPFVEFGLVPVGFLHDGDG
ncbi:MAG TPA: DegT/DnrJ/EryC1/StrS family aminotransferase, partial [Actinomycetota bacterium]